MFYHSERQSVSQNAILSPTNVSMRVGELDALIPLYRVVLERQANNVVVETSLFLPCVGNYTFKLCFFFNSTPVACLTNG